MEMARAMAAEGKRVGVLFGPERAGLENEDVALAQAIVTVPVNPDFPSLNLAQCVLLVGYEWRRQTEVVAPEVMALARTDFATGIEVERLGDHFEERLEAAGFFFPAAQGRGDEARAAKHVGPAEPDAGRCADACTGCCARSPGSCGRANRRGCGKAASGLEGAGRGA